MGLIRAAAGAIGSALQDQWKEAIRCEDLSEDVLMVKKTTPNGVISNGSTVIVAPGQCAILYDNGRVIDATAEKGTYTFDSSSTPSFFAGQFGDVFKEMWQRFTYNGGSAKQQAVFFINIKEIMNNKFGTPAPVPFQDWAHIIPNQMTGTATPLRVEIKCFGRYTFKIIDPALFMSQIAGTADVYTKESLVEQMRAEVVSTFKSVLNELGTSKKQIPALELPGISDSEFRNLMSEKVFDEQIRKRGIEIVSFAVESVTLTDESEKKIDEYELSSNSYMQQGKLVGSYANAVEEAAKNANGAANGFMGIGMMNMASGGVVGGVTQGPWQQQNTAQSSSAVVTAPSNADTWECPNCKKKVEGRFCSDCGAKKPDESSEKKCPKCGAKVNGKFCSECGQECSNE